MSEAEIVLDKSKVHSTCHGERTPEDPLYQVHYWQGAKLNGHMVLLPFDSQGTLVPDDGKTVPFDGTNSDGKPCKYHPLYSPKMRQFLELKKKRLTANAAAAAAHEPVIEEEGDAEQDALGGSPEDDVNLELWLRGRARYEPFLIKAAYAKRYHKKTQKLSEIVVDLVADEKLIPEDQVCDELAKYLPAKVAA